MQMAAFIKPIKKILINLVLTQTFRVVMGELGESEWGSNLGIGVLEQTNYILEE